MSGLTVSLTPDAVNDLFRACLAPDEASGVVAEGIVNRAAFIPSALEIHFPEIVALLAELPDPFQKSRGGGWSFLNACMDRHDRQWTGEHRTMEMLFMLGLAIGKVSLLMPRELWDALPGGMPYYAVDDTP